MERKLDNIVQLVEKYQIIKEDFDMKNTTDEELAQKLEIPLDVLVTLNEKVYAAYFLDSKRIADFKKALDVLDLGQKEIKELSFWSYLFILEYSEKYSDNLIKKQLKYFNSLNFEEDYRLYKDSVMVFDGLNRFSDLLLLDEGEIVVENDLDLLELKEKVYFITEGMKKTIQLNNVLKKNYKIYFKKIDTYCFENYKMKYLPSIENIYLISSIMRCCLYKCFEPELDDDYENQYPILAWHNDDIEKSFIIWCDQNRIITVFTYMEMDLTVSQKEFLKSFAKKNGYDFG
ncbi:MAG: hypothetical protein PUB19_01690 [Lachnospiraceae bacterium]|nr:hypothetical protein [Lachnospiraceae bacterium]